MIGFFVNFFHKLRTHFREEFKSACGKTVLKSWVSSSNVNKVIRAVLNLFIYFFFYEKISCAQAQRRNQAKAQKAQRYQGESTKI